MQIYTLFNDLFLVKLVKKIMQLIIYQVRKCVLDKRFGAKTSWRRSILQILLPINSRLICLYGFIPIKIILRFVLKWKITKIYRDTTKIMLGVIKKAWQKNMDVRKKRSDELKIEKLVDRKEE